MNTAPNQTSALSKRKRVAVLISGRGSNMAALIAATMEPDYPAIITKVISNKATAGGIEIARANGIETVVVERASFDTQADYEIAVGDELVRDEPAYICLAGFMRILSDEFVHRFSGKILNIHPSLLPTFKGLDTHHRAIEHGVRLHGCTVHIVTATLDDGPIIAQTCVPVLPEDDEDALSARVLAAEHVPYPKSLALLASGAIRMSGNRIIFSKEFPASDGDNSVSSIA
ncbi:MAG: phosphoribosylglycinamide formyltransferase [Rhizobiaceae bacterium]|nr:phosphoribosylglycinamide formyltransferase [Rhizobiaceae bacterium]